MSTHTPGPWIVERVPIQSRGGSNTCFRIGPFHACIYDDWRQREAGVTEEQNLANAHLIAAAPDLLAALGDSVKGLESIVRNIPQLREALRAASLPDSWLEGIPPKLDRARAALRKAEGQE